MEQLLIMLKECYGVSVTRPETILLAMTHSSYAYERGLAESNERLEFVGDAVLNAVVGEYLYRNCPGVSEGEMTRLRSVIVCESSLAYAAARLGLGDFLLLGRGEDLRRKESRPSILADAFEALVGAVFVDAGYEASYRFAVAALEEVIDRVLKGARVKDYKTALQEVTQRMGFGTPVYELEGESGPDHDKRFYMAARVGECISGRGMGRNKKEAEQEAAREALLALGYEL